MNFDPRFEIHDSTGKCIGRRLVDRNAARDAAANASHDVKHYVTLWWINDDGCPAHLLGHAARGTFRARPCMEAQTWR